MCPACGKPDDPDGLGIRDTRGRLWHGDCGRLRLASVARDTVGCCPRCKSFVTGVSLRDDRHRVWHFDDESLNCVVEELARYQP